MLSLWKHPLSLFLEFLVLLVSLEFLVLLVSLVFLVLFSFGGRCVMQFILFPQKRVWECRSNFADRRNFQCDVYACLREFHPQR